jgi:hypothetical protein
MPSDSDILGFSNIWYDEGIENKISQTLPDGADKLLTEYSNIKSNS